MQPSLSARVALLFRDQPASETLSRERDDLAEAEAVDEVEGNMLRPGGKLTRTAGARGGKAARRDLCGRTGATGEGEPMSHQKAMLLEIADALPNDPSLSPSAAGFRFAWRSRDSALRRLYRENRTQMG
jgi:hypothetical protein